MLTRFTFDPRSENLDLPRPEVLSHNDCEFPRIDDQYATKQHSRAFFDVMDPSLGTDFAAIASLMGGGFAPYNALGHINLKTVETEKYFPGRTHLVQEPVFIPRSDPTGEADGWLMALVNNYTTMLSELHIVDTRNFGKAKAIVYLPVRLRAGLHGNWVDTKEMEATK